MARKAKDGGESNSPQSRSEGPNANKTADDHEPAQNPLKRSAKTPNEMANDLLRGRVESQDTNSVDSNVKAANSQPQAAAVPVAENAVLIPSVTGQGTPGQEATENVEKTIQSDSLWLGAVRTSPFNLTAPPRLKSSQSVENREATIRIDTRDIDAALLATAIEKEGIVMLESDYMNQPLAGTHYLADPTDGNPIGYWAPDVIGSEKLTLVHCLAISRSRGYVWCLGLVPTGHAEREYHRVGLAFYAEKEWERIDGDDEVEIEVV